MGGFNDYATFSRVLAECLTRIALPVASDVDETGDAVSGIGTAIFTTIERFDHA